jgi:PAS domain S-box-containing protein
MDNQASIILVIVATIINSTIFGYVASNTKNNKTNYAYLVFLAFIILYTIFDCIIINIFDNIEIKNIIVKIQAFFWMPLSIFFLNFIYLFLGKKRDIIFNLFSMLITASIIVTLFSDKIILGYKGFNLGTMAYTGPWFLQITFWGILPPAFYSIYLIGIKGNIFFPSNKKTTNQSERLLTMQLKILFYGSVICLLISVITNVFLDDVLGYSGELHLASLSLSVQSIFLLPALLKYNFLNQPMEKIGDELYLHSSDAVFITSDAGIIINLNRAARKLFDLKGQIVNVNVKKLFEKNEDLLLTKNNIETKTRTGHYVTIAQNPITRGGLSLGKILVIRDVSAHKEVEEKLLKSEKAHKHFIESTSDVIYNVDLEGNFIFVNNVFEKMSGYTSDDVIGTNSSKMVREDYKQKVYDTFSSLIPKKKGSLHNSLQMEVPVMDKNGDRLWMELGINTIVKDNKITGFSVISRDITERKGAEEKLLQTTNLLKTAQDIGQMGSFKYNIQNETVVWSDKLYEIYGLEKNQFTLTNENFLNKVMHPDFKETTLELVETALHNKENSLDYFHKIITKDRAEKWMHSIAQIDYNKKGEPIHISGTSQDITELYSTRLRLEESETRLQKAQELAQLGSWEYDHKTEILNLSPIACDIFDVNINSPISRETFWENVHPDDDDKMRLAWKEAKKLKKTLNKNVRIKIKNGNVKHIHIQAEFGSDIKGDLDKTFGTVMDMTELYSTRLRFEESERRLQKAQEMARLGNWEENHKTGEVYWSSELRKMFGLNKTDKISPNLFWEYLHPDDLDWMKNRWIDAEKTMAPYRGMFRIKLKNGVTKHLSEQAEFIQDSDGKLYKTIGTVIDITEIRQYQEELRSLSSHIQNVQEQERGHIAREIHDELGQNLTSINMDIDYLKGKGDKNTDSDILNRLNSLSKLVDHTIKTTRRISQELRPSILDDLGLKSAIEWQVAQYKKRSESIYKLNMIGNDENISTEQSTTIFRIAQESLTNIARHAKATKVEICLSIEKLFIKLEIKDDGIGMSENNTGNNNASFGVFGMKERASILGGKLEIVSTPKEGTAIIVELPLQAKIKA